MTKRGIRRIIAVACALRGGTMDRDDVITRAAQSNAMVAGIVDALALGGADAFPTIDRVVVLFDGSLRGEPVAGAMSFRQDGSFVSLAETAEILGDGVVQIASAQQAGDP
jgi:hypothetical protein